MPSILLITLIQLEDFAFRKLLSEHCNGDIRLIQKQVKNRLGLKTKPTYQMKKIKKILPLLKSPKGRQLNGIISLKEQIVDN